MGEVVLDISSEIVYNLRKQQFCQRFPDSCCSTQRSYQGCGLRNFTGAWENHRASSQELHA